MPCIATANMELVRISMNTENAKICVEIESKIIDIDDESVAEYFMNVLKIAKFIT